MNVQTAQQLCAINTEFYRSQARSFSQTRTCRWPGWEKLLDHMPENPQVLSIVDLAAGNLRFEEFLTKNLPETSLKLLAVDNCPELVESQKWVADLRHRGDLHLMDADIVSALLDGLEGRPEALERLERRIAQTEGGFHQPDLVCSFGFIHHVPTYQARLEFLVSMVKLCGAGGLVVLSFWQFMNSETIQEKAFDATCRALRHYGMRPDDLDEQDWFLGWRGQPNLYRYCHHFDEGEIQKLLEDASRQVDFRLEASWSADGKTDDLNRYLLLRKA